MRMTINQRRALDSHVAELRKSFRRAQRRQMRPGTAATWMLKFLRTVFRTYRAMLREIVDGKPTATLIGDNPRKCFSQLLKESTNRDVRTISRWAAALANAFMARLQPRELVPWLQAPGGISGRARKTRTTSKPNDDDWDD